MLLDLLFGKSPFDFQAERILLGASDVDQMRVEKTFRWKAFLAPCTRVTGHSSLKNKLKHNNNCSGLTIS